MTETKAPVSPVASLPRNPLAGLFQKPEEVGPPKCLLMHGEPNTHKTSITGGIMKVADFHYMLYVDIDNGTEVFDNDPEIHGLISEETGPLAPGEKRINIFGIDKTDENAFGMLKYLFGGNVDENGKKIPGIAFDPALGYDVVVIDALDVAQEVAVEWLLAHTFTDDGKKLNTMKAWGEVSKWTSDLAWGLQNTKHLTGVIVMHSKIDAEETGKLKIKPKLQGSVKDSIAGIPSLVAYLEKVQDESGETHIVATIGDHGVITSKNRYSINEPITDFTMPKLYERIGYASGKTKTPTATTATQPTAVKAAA